MKVAFRKKIKKLCKNLEKKYLKLSGGKGKCKFPLEAILN